MTVAASGSGSIVTAGVKWSSVSATDVASAASAAASRSICTTSADNACTPPRRMP
jgi:hypothetical protein